MPVNAVLYSVARNESGELIHARDAEKGTSFFCGLCKEPFVLRKSGNFGPRSKRPHFAHKVLTANCTPESALHFEFKTLLEQEIERRIKSREELTIAWKCIYCDQRHVGDLLKKASRVALEQPIDKVRPDIALIDDKGNVIAAVEVVVTHAPEDSSKEFYRLRKIALVELHLRTDEDLSDVPAKLRNADHVQLCPDRKRCLKCRHFQAPIELNIIATSCYNCRNSMKAPFITGDDSRGSHVSPDRFSRQEIAIAREHGCIIEWQYSRTLNTKYWAATCGKCRRFIGRRHLFVDHIVPFFDDGGKAKIIKIGDFCSYCEAIESGSAY